MVISIEGSHRSIRNSSTVGSVEGATGAREQLVETAGQNELVVDEHEDATEHRVDRHFGLLTFFEIRSKQRDEVPTDEFFMLGGHDSDGRGGWILGLWA